VLSVVVYRSGVGASPSDVLSITERQARSQKKVRRVAPVSQLALPPLVHGPLLTALLLYTRATWRPMRLSGRS
jgi:hypothetical protein